MIDGGKGGSHGSFGDEEDSSEFIGEEEEELYNRIKEMVIMEKKVSTSYIQRRFKIGYGRAARMIDQLEREGIVSPPEGNGRRKVLIETGKDNQLQDQENDSIEIEKQKANQAKKRAE